MIIEYKYEKGIISGSMYCATECPNNGEGHVGSNACHNCKYFISDNESLLIVDCNYPEKSEVVK